MAHRRVCARAPGIKVLLYVLRIPPPLITIDTYITSRSAKGQYSLRRHVSKTSRDSPVARLKPSITRQGSCRVLRAAPYPLNRDRSLNYFYGMKRSQHILFPVLTYRVARLSLPVETVSQLIKVIKMCFIIGYSLFLPFV